MDSINSQRRLDCIQKIYDDLSNCEQNNKGVGFFKVKTPLHISQLVALIKNKGIQSLDIINEYDREKIKKLLINILIIMNEFFIRLEDQQFKLENGQFISLFETQVDQCLEALGMSAGEFYDEYLEDRPAQMVGIHL